MTGMQKTKQIALCAVMVALALTLSYTERLIPLQLLVPLPGIKLGLANTVTLIALYLFKPRFALMILIPRCLFGALFGGGVTGLLFSLCGGILALGVMAGAKKISLWSIYGVSVLGAAAHNVGQILAAIVLMRSVYIGAYLPYLLIVAVVTGLLTGGACAGVLRLLPCAFISLPAEMSRS